MPRLGGRAEAVERARRLPHATVQVRPNATHWLPMQVADGLAEGLVRFCGR